MSRKGYWSITLFAIVTLFVSAAHADWETSTAEPTNLSGACFYPSDGYANMRGFTDYICTWEPDYGENHFDDTLGRRADLCVGNPAQGDVDLTTTDGKYCARVHGLTATDGFPLGFRMGWSYIRWVGFYGIDMDNFWATEEIGSYRVGPHTHVLFCSGDLTGPANDSCRGQTQKYVLNTGSTATASATVPFAVHGLTAGANTTTLPALCPYLSGGGGPSPSAWVACTSVASTGLTLGVAGDGAVHSGNFATIGNPITGPGGSACLGQDSGGHTVVLVYPNVGAPVSVPGGTAYTPLCP